MSILSRYKIGQIVFDHWKIVEVIGEGSEGKTIVFKITRTDSSWGESALKVIPLIEEYGILEEHSSHMQAEYHFAAGLCKDVAETEVLAMDKVKGNTNIVSYSDHCVVDWSDGKYFGRDLLIRMELLRDLRTDERKGKFYNDAEIIKIGRDICTALDLCHRKDILHRDIKPENIFINADGNYKLGDFGIAKILEACTGHTAETGQGTPEYAAPEQGLTIYDTRVDIYSLGLVLYELGNNNKLPYISSNYVSNEQMRCAIRKRCSTDMLPPPCNTSESLSKVILKACAKSPEMRYQSAREFIAALCR